MADLGIGKTCSECKVNNRPEAIFCNRCGTPLADSRPKIVLDDVVGLAGLKKELESIMGAVKLNTDRKQRGMRQDLPRAIPVQRIQGDGCAISRLPHRSPGQCPGRGWECRKGIPGHGG